MSSLLEPATMLTRMEIHVEEGGARNVTAALVERGMLTTPTHRAPFPADVAERWFPNLYPANAGSLK